jgi:cell wall-associated NlpC family hydrolase
VFADCGASESIGAQGEQPVRTYYDWFSAQGRADALPPQPGDLVVYGPGFAHIAIYVGGDRAISALSDGIGEHHATELHSAPGGELMPVEGYLHVEVGEQE